MKTITLTDKELRELGRLLNSGISECLKNFFVFTDEKRKTKSYKAS